MTLRGSGGVLAICSALCLGGGFVWHRHHQRAEAAKLDTEVKSPAPVVFPSSKNIDAIFKLSPEKEERDPELLPSSKIGRILKPEDLPVTRGTIDGILDKHSIPETDTPSK
jgi:hypothetical protein